MALCKNMAITLMVLVNTIFALMGICIIGISSYGLATFEQWKDYMSGSTSLIVGVVFGIFVFLISLMGCVGAVKQNKGCLGIYLFFEFIICVVMIIASALVFTYGGGVKRGDTVVGRTVNNIVFESYKGCCGFLTGVSQLNYNDGAGNVTTTAAIPACPANPPTSTAASDSFLTCQYPYCDDVTKPDDWCSTVRPGDNVFVTREYCNAITLTMFDTYLIETDKCEQGIDQWGGEFVKFLADNMQMLGIGLAVCAGILTLLFVASIGLCCTHKDQFEADAVA
jgi:hypothetical protein